MKVASSKANRPKPRAHEEEALALALLELLVNAVRSVLLRASFAPIPELVTVLSCTNDIRVPIL